MAAQKTPVMRLSEVSKVYRGEKPFLALDRVSLDIYGGELVSIMGRSGSGKSTLLHLLGCLDRPTSGEIYICGRAISKMCDDEVADIRRGTIGFVFQAFNLAPTLTVFKNVELPLMIRGMPKAKRLERTMRNLELVGLSGKMGSMPSQLSGGEKQRVAIARALSNEPKIILADEPTGNLDSATSEEIIKVMFSLCHEHGITVILVTHDAGLAGRTKRIVHIKDGRIEKDSGKKQVRGRD